jgi:protein gp37
MWNKRAGELGVRERVFCASLADVFDNEVPAEWRMRLWDIIKKTPNLDWLLLTKRIGNARTMLPESWGDGWHNVWLGASIVNQAEANRDIPKLLMLPAHIRFLSMEPLLEHVEIFPWLPRIHGCQAENTPAMQAIVRAAVKSSGWSSINWVIVGGESGKNARPMHPEWVRNLRDQCRNAAVPFFFKQWGEWIDGRDAHKRGIIPSYQHHPWGLCQPPMGRVGKKLAGRELDGREWSEFPA